MYSALTGRTGYRHTAADGYEDVLLSTLPGLSGQLTSEDIAKRYELNTKALAASAGRKLPDERQGSPVTPLAPSLRVGSSISNSNIDYKTK